MNNEIENLKKQIKELQERVDNLEIWNPRSIPDIFEQVPNRCPVCMIEYNDMTNYCCPRVDCPSAIMFKSEVDNDS